jgi:hypothetical protein
MGPWTARRSTQGVNVGALPLFYRQPVALDRARHGRVRLDTATGFGFARAASAVTISAVEFERCAREYPIVFGAEAEVVHPLVLLGLRSGQNAFVAADGRWRADYIPAYLRRYPFILANQSRDGVYAVCVDEGCPGWDAQQGERLFADDGSQSPYLQRAVAFLREFQLQHEKTREFSANLRALDLLEPMQANTGPGGERLQMDGLLAVSRERLKSLEPQRLAGLLQTQQLELIYLHLFSLGNFGRLLRLVSAA